MIDEYSWKGHVVWRIVSSGGVHSYVVQNSVGYLINTVGINTIVTYLARSFQWRCWLWRCWGRLGGRSTHADPGVPSKILHHLQQICSHARTHSCRCFDHSQEPVFHRVLNFLVLYSWYLFLAFICDVRKQSYFQPCCGISNHRVNQEL